ncbi:MAG: HRDC domain-containing protein [Spirochaetia bacterium]|nr:HRDC domain-containing protein [Spirochaetia bacterium]
MHIHELTTNQEIGEYVNELEKSGQNIIALDLEGEFNLHCYGEHLCLVQIFDGTREVIIDPIAHPELTMMNEIFTKRNLLKIMYDASSDAALIQHLFGVRIASILDLRPAVSLLEYSSQSLSFVLEKEFSITPVNKKKFQQHNWMRRPISTEAIEYAMNDVRMLFELKDRLLGKLIDKSLLDQYILQNLYVQNGEIKNMQKDKYKKAKGFNRLRTEQKKLFKALFIAREKVAKEANIPPNSVLPNKILMEFCQSRNSGASSIGSSVGKRVPVNLKNELLHDFTNILQEHFQRSI